MPRTANAGACDKAQFAVLEMFVEEQGLIRTFCSISLSHLAWGMRVGATPFFHCAYAVPQAPASLLL